MSVFFLTSFLSGVVPAPPMPLYNPASFRLYVGGCMKDRVKGLIRIRAKDLAPNPNNWREHPIEQVAAFRKVLNDVGFADVLLVYESSDGKYTLIDGHMRAGLLQNEELPAVVLDVTEKEANDILVTLDPIAAMAKTNQEKLEELKAVVGIDITGVLSRLPTMIKDMEKKNASAQPIKQHQRWHVTCPACGEEFFPGDNNERD